MKAFKKAMSLIFSFVMLLSITCLPQPVLADEVQTQETPKFTLAEDSTSNFTADASAGTVVTDGTKNGYLYFEAATETGYATKWEATGTVTKSTNPYLSFGVRDSFGKTQWFCIFNNYISLQRGWDWSTNVYKQDGVHVVDSPAAAYFAWNNADQGGGKLNYKIVVENDVLKAYFSNDIYPEALAWSLPLTNSTFGGVEPILAPRRTFSNSLALELSGTGVTATALLPGWVKTEFHERAGINASKLPNIVWIDPDKLVRTALDDAAKGRFESVPDWKWKVAMFIADHGPRSFTRWFSKKLTASRKH